MNANLGWAPYRFMPYEERLRVREVEALTAMATATGTDVASTLVARATFVHEVASDDGAVPTEQAVTEAAHWRLRGGARGRQATRYLVHGLHEYRGKFNPQIARALINVVDPTATVIVDPFCGSGTTLVEALRFGTCAVGVDRHPLAHFMAQTKVRTMLAADVTALRTSFERVVEVVRDALKRGQDEGDAVAPTAMPTASEEYLRSWFDPAAVSGLFRALQALEHEEPALQRDLARLALSTVLRDASQQLPEDLRVRRRPPGFVAASLADMFTEAAERVTLALAERAETGPVRGDATVLLADGTEPGVLHASVPSGRRLVLTSPPYATALPYIDTDRLSLIALGLATPKEVRRLEHDLTGSREWSTAASSHWKAQLSANGAGLPRTILDFLVQVEAAAGPGAGFRRAAVPALLYRYFTHMQGALREWRRVLEPGEHAVLVVGRNRTGPADARILIDTPALLADVAVADGWSLVERMPFETWPRYGLHAENGVNGEEAVVLRA